MTLRRRAAPRKNHFFRPSDHRTPLHDRHIMKFTTALMLVGAATAVVADDSNTLDAALAKDLGGDAPAQNAGTSAPKHHRRRPFGWKRRARWRAHAGPASARPARFAPSRRGRACRGEPRVRRQAEVAPVFFFPTPERRGKGRPATPPRHYDCACTAVVCAPCSAVRSTWRACATRS